MKKVKRCVNCGTTRGKMRVLKHLKERPYICNKCERLLSVNYFD